MQSSLHKKLFLSVIFSVALGTEFFFGAGKQTVVAAIPVSCTPLGGISNNYQCTGTPSATDAPLSIGIDGDSGNCIVQCRNAGGSTLRYGTGMGADPFQWYCSGATDQTKTCTVSGHTILVATGLSPQKTVEECQRNDVACGIRNLTSTFVSNGVGGFFGAIVGSIAGAIQWLAQQTIGATNGVIQFFMGFTVSPASPNTPEFVKNAWTFTRNFVNTLFLLILALIGFTTILRLREYQFQQTLPALLVVALLVNFSGVLVGFVVDIGNIVTNAFLKMANNPQWSVVDVAAFGAANPFAEIGRLFVQIIYYSIAVLIYLTIMVIFALRTFVLWTLAIVSPIAFAMRILPATKRFWDDWWNQLVQWSLIGIPISFFMFLASLALKTPPSIARAPTNFLADLLSPFTTLFLLFAGITIAISMAPAGAQGVANFTRSIPKRLAETRIGQQALGGLAGFAQGNLGGIREGTAKIFEKIPGPVGKGLGWGIRTSVGAAQASLIEYAASKRRLAMPKNFDQMSEEELEEYAAARNFTKEDVVQFAARMQEKKKYKHTTQAFKDKVNAATNLVSNQRWLSPEVGTLKDAAPETVTKDVMINLSILEVAPEKREEARKKAQENIDSAVKEIQEEAKINPELQKEIDAWTAPDPKTGAQKTIEDLAAAKIYAQELKPQDVPNVIRPKTLPFRLAMKDSNPASLQRLMDNFDQETLQDMFRGIGGLDSAANTPQKLETLHKRNPRLVRALFTNPALLGLAWEGRNQMQDFANNLTANFDLFENKMRIQELIDRQSPVNKERIEAGAKLLRDSAEAQGRLIQARQGGAPPDQINTSAAQIRDIQDRLAILKETVFEKDAGLKRVWDEMERLVGQPRGQGGRQQRRRRR